MTIGVHARALRLVFGFAALPLLGAISGGCGGETARSEECLPLDFEAVVLADGGAGFLRCNASGTAYVPYDGPDPSLPLDAGSPDTGPTGTEGDAATACSKAGGAKLGFMCPGCSADTDCQTGLVCFDFPNKTGNICTRDCTPAQQATLCPAPSEGCGNNGHCKP
jgi:hypothetical protein